jgi:hypothetical protein
VLHEIDADVAAVEVLAQSSHRVLRVGQHRSVAVLNGETIEKAQPVPEGVRIPTVARDVAGVSRSPRGGGDCFEIHGRGVAGRVGLVVGEKRARP